MKSSVKKAAGIARIAKIRSFHFNYKMIHRVNCSFNCFKQENYLQTFENSSVYLFRAQTEACGGQVAASASNSHQGESQNFTCWMKNQEMTTLQQVFGTKACVTETVRVCWNPAERLKQAPQPPHPPSQKREKTCLEELERCEPAASCSLSAIITYSQYESMHYRWDASSLPLTKEDVQQPLPLMQADFTTSRFTYTHLAAAAVSHAKLVMSPVNKRWANTQTLQTDARQSFHEQEWRRR